MTNRERRYLFIIATLSLYQHHLIASTNAHIESMELEANRLVDELRQKQVETDNQKIAVILDSAEAIWQEKEAIEAKLKKVEMRRKEAKRWQSDTMS